MLASHWMIELEDIERDTSRIISKTSVEQRKPQSAKSKFQAGDVLYGKLRPYLNKVLHVDFAGYCSNEIIAITPGELNARYLYYFLKSPIFLSYVSAVTHGVRMPRLGTEQARSAPFPLAPASEQKRIAQKLDILVAQVNALKAHIDRILRLIERLRESTLSSASSGMLSEDWRSLNPGAKFQLHSTQLSARTRRGVPSHVAMPDAISSFNVPSGWIWASAAELLRAGAFIDIKDGNHGTNHPKSNELGTDGLPFVTAANVLATGRIDYEAAPKISGTPLSRIRVGFAEPGDVVFTHKGTVGRVAINDRSCVLTPQTTYYRLDSSQVSSKYLRIFLQSPLFTAQTAVVKSQTTRDFVPITAQYALFHLLPPLPEQLEIVRRVERLFSIAEQLEAKVATAKQRIDALTQSILAKAFRGELVPQDPNDEPAGVLLERIRAQRAAAPKPKRGRKVAAN